MLVVRAWLLTMTLDRPVAWTRRLYRRLNIRPDVDVRIVKSGDPTRLSRAEEHKA
jgi:hypothetical protein